MPLLTPTQIHPREINAVIRPSQSDRAAAAGELSADGVPNAKGLRTLLEKHNLTADDALESLGDVMRSGGSDAIRHRATETALKLNGLLDKDSNKQDFHVTINILDGDYNSGLNPILLPR